jgi:superoxide dismutase
MAKAPLCFVVMPFRADLSYFYLYVRKYLQEKYRIRVERGDTNVMTKALMDKIREQIVESSVVIGDVTGSSPNVFFELGVADAIGTPIIFLTQEPPENAPVDIRQFEFIKYDLGHHEEFLAKLDNAIQNVLGKGYESLFEKAHELLREFNTSTKYQHAEIAKDEFRARLMRAEAAEGLPLLNDVAIAARFLLPKIIQDATDLSVMQRVTDWVTAKYPI